MTQQDSLLERVLRQEQTVEESARPIGWGVSVTSAVWRGPRAHTNSSAVVTSHCMWFCQQEEISLPKKTVRVCGVMALCSHYWRMAQSALHMKSQMCSSKSWNTHAPWRGSDFYNCAVRRLPDFVDGSPHASTSCFNADSPLPSRESTPELLWCSLVFQLIQHLLWKHGNAMGVRASHYASLPCADPEDSMATFGSKEANILSVMDIIDMFQ